MDRLVDAISVVQLGSVGGAVGVVGAAVLAALYVGHRRQVRRLGRWAATQPRRVERVAVEPAPGGSHWGPQRWAAGFAALLVVVGILKLALNDGSNGGTGPAPTRGPATPADGVRPLSAAEVRVVNAAGVPGLAQRAASRLRAAGFHVAAVGNATPAQAVSAVLSDSDDRRAATAAADLLRIPGQPRASGQKPAPGTDVLVVLGHDAG
jgi:hypothetical protein